MYGRLMIKLLKQKKERMAKTIQKLKAEVNSLRLRQSMSGEAGEKIEVNMKFFFNGFEYNSTG